MSFVLGSRRDCNFVACERSKILRKLETQYSYFPNPPTQGHKGRKSESSTVISHPLAKAPIILSFVDFLQAFDSDETYHSKDNVLNADSANQTNATVDFHSVIDDYSCSNPGRNVVQEMMIFICHHIMSELKHVRYNVETHLPRNSSSLDVSKDRAQFLSLNPNDAIVHLLPKMPFFKEFLMPFVKNLDHPDHQPQKSLLMWTIFCCLHGMC